MMLEEFYYWRPRNKVNTALSSNVNDTRANAECTPGRTRLDSRHCSPDIDVSNDVDVELQQIPATTSGHHYIMTRVRTGTLPSDQHEHHGVS